MFTLPLGGLGKDGHHKMGLTPQDPAAEIPLLRRLLLKFLDLGVKLCI